MRAKWVTSGVINTTQQASRAPSLAVTTALASARTAALPAHAADPTVRLAALTSGYRVGFTATAVFALAGAARWP